MLWGFLLSLFLLFSSFFSLPLLLLLLLLLLFRYIRGKEMGMVHELWTEDCGFCKHYFVILCSCRVDSSWADGIEVDHGSLIVSC